jgi:glycogen operon protein
VIKPEKVSELPENQKGFRGYAFPLGATVYDEGVNFSIYCRYGQSVELLLFDQMEAIQPARIIKLTAEDNRTYYYWHVFLPGIKSGQLYSYRIFGENNPARGHWFDPQKILLDPYSKTVAVPQGYKRSSMLPSGLAICPSMKSVVSDCSGYDWEDDNHLHRPFSQTIIYELHVRGFTKNSNSGVAPERRGTYAGLIEKIPYLVELGITAVELLPVFQFDEEDAPAGLANYWGYSPVSFFAPHQGYSSDPENPLAVLDEFRNMVKALHKSGIEIILDVVFNHTAEGGSGGPTYSFRGIDNSTYYMLDQHDYSYLNYSGCGNTVNANQAIVRRLIMDSLHFWVSEMHVDGFRFDLASILSRDETGSPIKNPPVLWDIESDPVFAGIKLIAEAWDAAGLYQVGSFAGDSWKEWNGKFRDDVRRFLKGDEGFLSSLATRLVGSPDLYFHQAKGPEQSINFVTCHDGFTLHDLVSYNHKHNERNNEENRDGSNDNYSWNCGWEGETDNAAILALRARQIRNFHVLNLLSVGTPMICMGDELGRTQKGNNNAYCQDNEISWFNWDLKEKYSDLYRFVRLLIDSRQLMDLPQRTPGSSLSEILLSSKIKWHGTRLNQPDWSGNSHSIAFTVTSLGGNMETHFFINAFTADLLFEIPPSKEHKKWKRWIDTSLESADNIYHWPEAPEIASVTYNVVAHSIVVLIRFF